MRQRIAKHEQTLQNPNLGFFSGINARVSLFLTYIQYAFVHSFTLLFLHPTKSFVALNSPASNGLWRRSYIEHLAYRNQVRFASLSGFFVLLTSAMATFAITITVFPDRGVSPAFAASFTVNSNNDLDDGTCDAAHCSLREAISKANAAAGADTITFSGAPYTITPTSALPALSGDATTILGGGNITIDGSLAGADKLGFDIQGDNNVIKGLIVHSFNGSAIAIATGADNSIVGGSSSDEGNVLYGNGQNGVLINGGTGNQVVGNKIGQKADGSLSKNGASGVKIMGGSNTSIGSVSSTNYITDSVALGLNADSVTLYGNVVGMSSSGLTGVMTDHGVTISGDNTVVGGTAAGQRNYIVASQKIGVVVDENTSGTSVIGNYIGVAADGTAKGNGNDGIQVKGAGITVSSNTIGANTGNGIFFGSVSAGTNTISENTIGVLPSGAAAANGNVGILASSSSNLTISGNVVGNSTGAGIELDNSTATIINNYVGLDQVSSAMPNGTAGIVIGGTSTGSLVGGSVADRNFVGNNLAEGILVSAGTTGTPDISYNYVGVTVDGTSAAPNASGIALNAAATVTSNLISGNIGNGIFIDADSSVVTLNTVGLNAAGDTALGNGGYGVYVAINRGANIIGQVGQGNSIAGNVDVGVLLDTGGTANEVVGNHFNCNSTCTTSISDNSASLVLQGTVNTTVVSNYFGGAGSIGTLQIILGATGSEVTGNFFGQGTDGSDIANGGLEGILVDDSDSQTIGTIDAGNIITHFTTGITLDNSSQVSMRGNTFSGNTTNVAFLNNANNNLESPEITTVTADGAAGTSNAAGTIDIYEDGVYLASGESDGTWAVETTLDVDKTITATITDSEGNTSNFAVFAPEEPDDTTPPVSSASPAGGVYSGTQNVTLSATDDVDTAPTIFYTTDGSTPTTDSTLYTSALTIATDTTLKFFALDAADNAEEVNTEVYNIKQDTGGVFGSEDIQVKVNGETIHPACTSCVIRTNDTTPTFLGEVSKSFIDYIVRLVIFASLQQGDGTIQLDKVFAESKSIIQNPNDSTTAIWKIAVPEEQALDLGEYVVKIGLRDPDGNVVKPMRKKVSLAVTPPNPVIVSPQPLVYTESPTFIGNALNDMRVIARVFQDGVEVGHCQTDVVNNDSGTGSYACALPFDLKTGQYTARVNSQDPVSELISAGSEVVFSVSTPVPTAENVPFSLVPGEISVQSQYLTTDNTPVFVGLATNDTEVVLVVDGTKLFTASLTNDDSGVGHWEATTSFLTDGIHTAYALVRSQGAELNRTDTFQFRIVAPTVVPTISAPTQGTRVAVGQQIIFNVLGHSGDSVELSLSGSTDITVASVFSDDPSGTGFATFTFSHGLPRGEWVATAVATDLTGKPSLTSEAISLRVFIPIAVAPIQPQPIDEPIEEPTNVNEVPTNVNEVPTNTNEVPTNTNETPVNTNEVPINTNEVPVGNVNEAPTEVPTKTPDVKEPLPEPPPAFTFPESVEHFPRIDKTPEDLTSEEVEAVRIVLNDYLKSELQILPAEQAGNAVYLSTEKTADNEPLLIVGQEVGLEASSGITNALNTVFRTFGLQQTLEQTESLIVFRGTTVPFATVTLTIFSDPIVKIAQADADGRWTMTVAADSLPPGDHSAYVQTSYGEATSDEVQIARFVVVQQERLSNTTWLFIINLGVILIVLLAAIFLQLRKRTQLLEIKQTAIPAESPWKSGSVKLSKKEEQSKKTKGPNDLGDIMGI